MRYFILFLTSSLIACSGSGEAAADTAIYDVQGTGASSPLDGQEVVVEGIVSGDFQAGDADEMSNLGGFYVQSAPDNDPATSDGVFVFDGDNPAVDVNPGDRVRVAGSVKEYFGETQIVASTVTVIGSDTIQPTDVTLPVAATITNSDGFLIADLERYEGMLVRFPQTLTVSQTRQLERFGQMLLSTGGRQFAFTNQQAPDVTAYRTHLEAIAARRIVLDDGMRSSNTVPIRYLTAGDMPNDTLRIGDEISGVTGVLRFSRGSGSAGPQAYRLMPTADPVFESKNPRPGKPTLAGKTRITSLNLNNFFSTIDTGEKICGPVRDSTCRGANSPTELSRQLGRIIIGLAMIDSDVVGLVEIENNERESLQRLVDAVNAAVGAGTYSYIDTGTIGTDAIKVGLLYKPANVQPVGSFAVLESSVDSRFKDHRSRPVLAQTFQDVADGGRLTVLVNHLKSKGSSCDADGDPEIPDGQGDCSKTRNAAAIAMIDWIATDPTSSGDPDFLIIGDPNAHTRDDAITTFGNAGYADLAEHFIGADSYSFEFDGMSGALDHALASRSLIDQVVDVVEWHINADEPRALDYNLEYNRDADLFDADLPYRASDHDPLLIGLQLAP